MKNFLPLALAASLAAAAGCGRGPSTGGFDGVFEKLSRARGYEDAKKFYTSGTVAALGRAADDGVIAPGDRHRILPLFNEKTKWVEESKKIEGSRGSVRIRYTEHPVENMTGFEMEFRLRREGGEWKIDLEDEVRQALGNRAGVSVPDYLNNMRKGY